MYIHQRAGFIHQRTGSNFRVTPWPTSGAGHFRLFNKPKLSTDLSVIAEYIAEALFNTNRAFVRHSTFTLVNVVSPIANLSYGYNKEPYESIRRFHPLSFTFAFTRRDTYNGVYRPRFMLRPYPQTTFWGFTLLGNSDFLTVNIPKRVMREAGLLIPNMREMEWLYMAIGAFSKGFARQFDFYTTKGMFRQKPISVEVAKSRFYHARFQAMLKRVPYNYWGYNRDMWQLAPNFISPRAANEDFLDFYCRYLSEEFYEQYKTNNVKRIERAARDYLKPGVQQAINAVNAQSIPDNPSRNFLTVQHMLDNNISSLGRKTGVDNIVQDLLSNNFGEDS